MKNKCTNAALLMLTIVMSVGTTTAMTHAYAQQQEDMTVRELIQQQDSTSPGEQQQKPEIIIIREQQQNTTPEQQQQNTDKDILVQTTDKLGDLAESAMSFIPGVIGAVIILIVGYFVSKYLGRLIQQKSHDALLKINFDGKTLKEHTDNSFDTSYIIGAVIRWFVFLLFVVAAADQLELKQVTEVLKTIWLWFPNIIAVAIVIILGVLIVTRTSKWADDNMTEKTAKQFKAIIKASVFVIIASIALTQIGIGEIILPIVVAAVSISLAIALGYGFKDVFRKLVRGIESSSSEKLKVGQKIKIGDDDGIEGTVTEVHSSSVTLRNEEGDSVIVPKDEISKKSITIKNGGDSNSSSTTSSTSSALSK